MLCMYILLLLLLLLLEKLAIHWKKKNNLMIRIFIVFNFQPKCNQITEYVNRSPLLIIYFSFGSRHLTYDIKLSINIEQSYQET